MSRFNTLYRGEPQEVAEELGSPWEGSLDEGADHLRIALINAMVRIARLETEVARLKQDPNA